MPSSSCRAPSGVVPARADHGALVLGRVPVLGRAPVDRAPVDPEVAELEVAVDLDPGGGPELHRCQPAAARARRVGPDERRALARRWDRAEGDRAAGPGAGRDHEAEPDLGVVAQQVLGGQLATCLDREREARTRQLHGFLVRRCDRPPLRGGRRPAWEERDPAERLGLDGQGVAGDHDGRRAMTGGVGGAQRRAHCVQVARSDLGAPREPRRRARSRWRGSVRRWRGRRGRRRPAHWPR